MSIVYIGVTVLILVVLWMFLPYSPLKGEFKKQYRKIQSEQVPTHRSFSANCLADKPKLLHDYICFCGLLGKPMMHHSVTTHYNVDFLMKENEPTIKIKYTQVNFADTCQRLAFIDTRMAWILPFQGLDDYVNGTAHMKGVVGKLFTVFNVENKEMDQSALVTVLAEGIVCPSFFMNENIVWAELDDTHLEATLTQYGITVSGVFEFDANGAIIGFYTKDRFQENNDSIVQRDWIARCGAYIEVDGIRRPTYFQGIWVYPQEEQIYFNCDKVDVQYHY